MPPLYEYFCESCGNQEELLQKFNDPSPACNVCNSGSLDKDVVQYMTKKMSKGSFILKGGCWYSDGYSKKG